MKRLPIRILVAALLSISPNISAQDDLKSWEDAYHEVLAQNEQRALSMLQDRYNALSPGIEKLYISSKIHGYMTLRGQPYFGNALTHHPEYTALEQSFIEALNKEEQLDFDAAIKEYVSLLKYSIDSKQFEGEVLFEYHLCRVLNRQGQFNKASLYCASLHDHLNNTSFSVLPRYRALHVIGNNYDFTGEYQKALDVFKEYLSGIPEHVDPSGVYNDAALVLNSLGKVELAKEYLSVAIQQRTKTGSQLELAQSHYNMGEILLAQGDFNDAIEHFQKTESIVQYFNYLYGLTYAQLGLGKAHIELEKFNSGNKYLLDALESASIQGNDQIRGEIYLALAKGHQKQRKFILAEDFSSNAKTLAERINSEHLKGLALQSLANIAEAQGKYRQALEHYQGFVKIELEKRDKQNQSAYLALDSERQKYARIQQDVSLNQKNLEQKQLIEQITSENKLLYFLIACLILLLLSSYYTRRKLIKVAEMDLLTGAWTRAAAIRNIKRVPRARDDNHKHLIILFDLDDFKQVNDAYGHPTGDLALSHVSKVVKERLSHHDIFARLGGEEFAIVMHNVDELDIKEKVESLHTAIATATFEAENHEKLNITASFSYLSTSKSLADFDDLYSILDQALYQVKKTGKNQIIDAFNEPITLPTAAYV